MSIKSFFLKLELETESVFNALPSEIKQAAHIAVLVTENIKTIADNPAVDILTAIIPGDTDDKIVNLLRLSLPVILRDLRLFDDALIIVPENQVLARAASNIQRLNGDIQNAFLQNIAVLTAREIMRFLDKQLSWSDAVYLIEWCYQQKVNSATD